jgi:Fumarylacetoacetate (FAA) hydrolase family
MLRAGILHQLAADVALDRQILRIGNELARNNVGPNRTECVVPLVGKPIVIEGLVLAPHSSPGDVIATGTGAGVGMAKGIKVKHGEIDKVFVHMYAGKARLLKPHDTVAVEIEEVGRLENKVAAPAD